MPEDVRTIIYDFHTAVGEGRTSTVLNYFNDNAVFTSYAPIEVFPFLGRQTGKAAIAAALAKVYSEYQFLTYLPISTIVQENDAAVIVMGRLRQRSTDRIIQLLIAHFIQFRDGRITELREFMDSFDAVQQVLGRELDLE